MALVRAATFCISAQQQKLQARTDSPFLSDLYQQHYRRTNACTEGFGYKDGKSSFLQKVEEATSKVNRYLASSKKVYAQQGGDEVFRPYFDSLHTGKGDTSVQQIQEYCLRDGFKYNVMWVGRPELFDNAELWHYCSKFIAYCVSLDDICVPYPDVASGRYKFLGESLADLLFKLMQLDEKNELDPRWLKVAMDDVMYGAQLQFFEKLSIHAERNPGGLPWPEKSNFIQMFRNEPDLLQGYLMRSFDGFSLACTCIISYLQKRTFKECKMEMYHASSLGDMMGMDIGKDIARVGLKCPTNFIERLSDGTAKNRGRLEKACELFYAINDKLKPEPTLRRYSEVSLFFASSHDRYLERQNMTRFPIEGYEQFQFTYKPIPLPE